MRDRWISHKFHADWFCNSPVQAEMCRHLSQHVAGVTTCITFLHNAFDFLLFEIHRPARRPKDRKSTRLNSSHGYISYAVFCLKKKKWLLAGGAELEVVKERVLPSSISSTEKQLDPPSEPDCTRVQAAAQNADPAHLEAARIR